MISIAQMLLDAKADLPTQLGSAALRMVDSGVLRHSLFSARMTNADAVQGIRTAVARILSSVVPSGPAVPGPDEPKAPTSRTTDTLADARLKLKRLGEALKYDPAAGGFPGQQYKSTEAEPGSIRDLYSRERMDLQVKTITAQAQGAAKNIWGNEPDALEQYPAWELVRVEARELPRGLIKKGKGVIETVPEDSWDEQGGRWEAACKEANDDEALKIWKETERMVARKDSGVWAALGAGAGGHDDALGNSYEPYAFNSGMGRVELSAKEFSDLGGDPDNVGQSGTDFGPSEVKVSKDRFDPDILAALKKGLNSGDLKFRVKVEVSK